MLSTSNCSSQKTAVAFTLKSNDGKTRITLSQSGDILVEGKKIGHLTNYTVTDLNDNVVAKRNTDGLVVNGNEKPLLKIADDGSLDNGSGILVSWDKDFKFSLGNDYLQLEPKKESLRVSASLLIALNYLIDATTITQPQNSDQTPKEMKLKHESQYPRIEVYKLRDAAHGKPLHKEEIDGKVYHTGDRGYEPYIMRETYVLDSATAEKLRNINIFLDYLFKEDRPVITLGNYFNVLQSQDTQQIRALFPANLDAFLSETKNGGFFDNLLYQYKNGDEYIKDVTIVRMDKDTWFVDNIFYNLSKGAIDEIIKDMTPIIDEHIADGEIRDFIDNSDIVKEKLTEGFTELEIPASD